MALHNSDHCYIRTIIIFSLLTMLEARIAFSHKSTYIHVSITYQKEQIYINKNNIKLTYYRKFNILLVPVLSCATFIIT